MARVYPLPKIAHPDFAVPNVAPRGPVAIDWDSPLAQGLSCFGVTNLKKNIVTNEPYQTSAGITYETRSAGIGSVADLGAKQDEYVKVGTVKSGNVGDFTMFAHIQFRTDYTFTYSCGFYNGSNGAGISPQNNTSRLAFFFDTTTHLASGGLTDGQEYILIATKEAGASGVTRIYSNGIVEVDTTDTDFSLVSNEGFVFNNITDAEDSNTFDSDSPVFSGGFYRNRALSQPEVQQLTRDLYGSLLKPAIPLNYFIPAAAPATGGITAGSLGLMGVGI